MLGVLILGVLPGVGVAIGLSLAWLLYVVSIPSPPVEQTDNFSRYQTRMYIRLSYGVANSKPTMMRTPVPIWVDGLFGLKP
jgi:hypothetical protein